MTRPSFQTDTTPCVPVNTIRGHQREVGLRDLFKSAAQIQDLALPMPPATAALLRVLTAIAARVTGLDDPDLPLAEWHERRTTLLRDAPGFGPDAVDSYFSAHVWDLYHPQRPLLQDPALTEQCPKSSGINSVIFGRPAGNNLAWLSPHTDTAPLPVASREALWHLLIHHYYGPSGTGGTRTAGTVTSRKLRAGPLRSTVSFHPQGANLYETLLLHQTPYTGDGQDIPDACPWEQPNPPDPLDPPAPLTWPGRLLTGRSLHAVLLVPSPDGTAAIDAYSTWAVQHDRLQANDPFLIYDTDPTKPADRMRTPRRANADRGVWRDLDALLLAGDETSTTRRPTVFGTLNDLPEPHRSRIRITVYGFDQEGQVNNRLWYDGTTPPIWTAAQEHDPAKAQRIAECRQAAEALGQTLAHSARTAWRAATSISGRPGKPARKDMHPTWERSALAAYWPKAEDTFWQLIESDQPARPAFAAHAVHCLEQATRHDRHKLRHAGPALALALKALKTAGAPPQPRHR